MGGPSRGQRVRRGRLGGAGRRGPLGAGAGTERIAAARARLAPADPRSRLRSRFAAGAGHREGAGDGPEPAGRRAHAGAGPSPFRSTWRARSSACSSSTPLDFVHVHEPFAPSASATALRHSRALNVGSFHSPTERVLSTQVARRFMELFFGRLDARTATFDVTRELVGALLPRRLRVVATGSRPRIATRSRSPSGTVEFVFAAEEERAALRLFLRALRRLPPQLDWRATIWTPRADDLPPRLGRALRERVRFVHAEQEPLAEGAGGARTSSAPLPPARRRRRRRS